MAAVVDEILAEGRTPFILDCIGSLEGSLAPLKRIARRGDRVAVMLPVIVRDASVSEEPVYEMDVANVGGWEGGVEVRGVRTHFYLEVRWCFPFSFSLSVFSRRDTSVSCYFC